MHQRDSPSSTEKATNVSIFRDCNFCIKTKFDNFQSDTCMSILGISSIAVFNVLMISMSVQFFYRAYRQTTHDKLELSSK